MSEDVRAGKMTLEEFYRGRSVHAPLARPLHDHGHRLDHGLDGRGAGHGLPGNAAIPAVDSRRNVLAQLAGRRIVEMVKEDLRCRRS